MFRATLAISLFLVSLPVAAYTVVLKDGKTIQATGPIRYEGAKAIVPLVGGGSGFLPANQVDRRRTESRNEGQPGYSWKYREVPRPPERAPEPSPLPHPPLGLFYPGGLTKDCYDDGDLPGKEKPADEEREVEKRPLQRSLPDGGDERVVVRDESLRVADALTESKELPKHGGPYGLIPIARPVLHAWAAAKVETADRGSSR